MSQLQRDAVHNAAGGGSDGEAKSGPRTPGRVAMSPLATPPRRVPALDTVFTIHTAREPYQPGHVTIAVPSRAMSNGSPSDAGGSGSVAGTPFNKQSLVAPSEPPPPVMRTMHAHHPRGMGKRRHTFSKNSKVLREGMLMKMKVMDRLHKGDKAWHKRFFQIRDGFFLWFPAKGPRKKPSGWVRVRDVMAVRMCDMGMGLPGVDGESVTRSFQVTTTARALYLRARTVDDMQEWMRMLVSSKCLTPAVNKSFAFPDIRSDDSPKERLLPRIASSATNATNASDASGANPETDGGAGDGDGGSAADGRHSRARRRSHKHKHKHKHKHGSDRRHSRHSSGSRGSRSPAHRRHSRGHRHRSRGSKHSGSKAGEGDDKPRRASGGSEASGRKSAEGDAAAMRGGEEASSRRRRSEAKSDAGDAVDAEDGKTAGDAPRVNGKGGGEGKRGGGEDADGTATTGGPQWSGAAAAAVARSGAGGGGAGADTPKSHKSIDNWEAHWDAENNRTVYVHKHTQETTTELPQFSDIEAGKWIKCFDYDAGQQYYFHTKTGATQYEQPEDYTPDADEVGQPGWGWGGWNKTLKSPNSLMGSPAHAPGGKEADAAEAAAEDAPTSVSGAVATVAADGKPIVHWIECWDDNYHCPYFVNMESNVSVWERPTGDHVRVTQYVEEDDDAAAVVEDEDVVVEDVASPANGAKAGGGVALPSVAGARVATGVVRRGSVEEVADEVVDEVDDLDHF